MLDKESTPFTTSFKVDVPDLYPKRGREWEEEEHRRKEELL